MLETETLTIDDAIAELDEQLAALGDALEEYDDDTDEFGALASRRDRLTYFRRGLQWERDEREWKDEAIEIGAITAGEKAMMNREAPSNADDDEMTIWYAAASTVSGAFVGDDLSATFATLADCHPGFVEWIEAKANALGIPGGSGNATPSSASSTGQPMSDTATSETTSNSSTSSSSASHTD